MISVHGVSPNEAYWRLLRLATQNALKKSSSRIGSCIELGHVFVEFDEGERLCLLQGRGINPVFALVESAWVLAGRNDLAPLQSVIANYGQYSDDGLTLNGAYGFRLRTYFGFDQIEEAIRQLRISPDSRRVVLSLYSGADLGKDTLDVPCNTEVILRIEESRLAMTVINRSNDLWLGVPYNWFMFRCLQTLIASRLNVPLGAQRHISTCMHLYESDLAAASRVVAMNSLYSIRDIEARAEPIDIADFLQDVGALSIADIDGIRSRTFKNVVERYRRLREGGVTSPSSNEHRQSALDIALDMWATERNLPKERTMATDEVRTNQDSPTHLALQRWIFSDDDRESKLAGIRLAAVNVKPYLNSLLNRDMPEGVKAVLEDPVSMNVSLQVVLELILGSIDPLLTRAPLGVQLRQRIQDLAADLGLPDLLLRSRELSEADLKKVFEHIFR